MKYEREIISQPAAPIEIPQVEIVIPVPRQWFHAIRDHGLNPASMIKNLAVSGGDFGHEGAGSRENFPEVFSRLCSFEIPEADCRMRFTIRRDVYNAFLVSAARVGKSAHEVALRIFARQLPIYQEHAETPVELETPASNLLPFTAILTR